MTEFIPLDPDQIGAHLTNLQCDMGPIRVVAETGSTNQDLADWARRGATAGATLIAEHQTLGRGRFERIWLDKPGAGIAMSVLLRPESVSKRWGWLPLIAGMAVRDSIFACTGLPAVVKWPNDVLLPEGKVDYPGKIVGILTEAVNTDQGLCCVCGIGINVDLSKDELPVDTASSLMLNGHSVDRNMLVAQVLCFLEYWFTSWQAGTDLTSEYLRRCATVGAKVQVQLDAQLGLGQVLSGVAVGVDADGALLVESDADKLVHAVSAGDVIHVR